MCREYITGCVYACVEMIRTNLYEVALIDRKSDMDITLPDEAKAFFASADGRQALEDAKKMTPAEVNAVLQGL